MLVNPLAHRDYGLQGTAIDVTVWDDRVEVRSLLNELVRAELVRAEGQTRARRYYPR